MPEIPLSNDELQSLVQELITDTERGDATNEIIYSLVGIYHTDWVSADVKKRILEFFSQTMPHSRWGYSSIIDDLGLGEKSKTEKEIEEFMEEWKRHSAWEIVMNTYGRENNGKMNKKSDIDTQNPIVLKSYLENFRDIMKRQMPNVPDKVLYQDGFTQMIELLLPLDKQFDIAYLEKIVDLAKTLQPPIDIEIPTNIVMESRRRGTEKEEKEEAEYVVKEKQQRKERGALTLEEQMADAIAEERYEDAADIKQKMDMLQRVMGNWRGSLTVKEGNIIEQNDLVVYADNLDLVQPDKPYDTKQHDQLRQRHYKRYRNEPGGSDEVLWEGLGSGYNDVDKGIGSDQYQDVGCPASINLASDKIKKLVRPTDPNMPNEKMERDPQEEKATTDTDFYEFNSMQDR